MDFKKQQYLAAMGVEVWRSKKSVEEEEHTEETKVQVFNNNANSKDVSAIWEDLEQQAQACTLCELSKTRTHVVFGVGNRNANLMLIGEAPGQNEDLQGKPFVGRAGMLLNEMLRCIDLDRKDVYIANILKCRPPRNRDPLPHEVALCAPYLEKQIELIKPKVIIAVGRIAAHFLLNTKETMGRLRGKVYKYGKAQIPLYVIYHPAYLLRSPAEKRKAFVDMLKIRKLLQELSLGFVYK